MLFLARKEVLMMHEREAASEVDTQDDLLVEEIEMAWWEPLGCKCEVDFEE